jgi:hypothetical protein
MNSTKTILIALSLSSAALCPSIFAAELSDQERDQQMFKQSEPENLNTYGYGLPVGSKTPEVD